MEQHDVQTPSTPPPAITVGARLKATREAQGLGLGEVADRLKLSIRQLEAIESDHFSALPGTTFVRGFVRNYARFLGIDPEPLMQDLEAQFPSSVREVANLTKGETSHPVEKKQAEFEPTVVRTNHRRAWLGLALVGVVVAGLVWWMVDGRNQHEEAASDQEGQLAPMLTESSASTAKPASVAAAVKPAASAPSVLTQSATSAAVVIPVKPAAASAPAVAAQTKAVPLEKAKTASAPTATTVAGAGSVRLVTKGDSWVSVTDADGNKLVYQLLTDGTEKTVSGKAPIKVVLGHASNVQLYFNGQPVNFASKIKGETAKIELK